MPIEPWMEGLLDAERMRAVDAWAIEDRGVSSLELMERAGAAVAEAADERAGDGPVRVVCGKGNNGGDGLVAARRLRETGFEVEVLLLWPADELAPDAAENLRRLQVEDGSGGDGGARGAARVAVRELAEGDVAPALAGSGAIVDALFGTGFSGAPREPAAAAIAAINSAGAAVVAADLPSGVDASTGVAEGAAVEAEVTVSFHAAKLGHWVAPGRKLRGELRVAPIGIPAGAPGEPAAGLIGDAVLELAPRRRPGSTKFSSGEVLVVGGSPGLTGAVCMAAQAAIRAGAGYATVVVPAALEPIFEVKLTEVMSRGIGDGRVLTEADADAVAEAASRSACVALGPGLGREGSSLALARALAARIEAPLVVDADGLNAHAGALESLAARTAPTVLTPHEGELARLLDVDSSQVRVRRLEHAREAAGRSGAIVVLKGDDSIVCDPDGRVAIKAVSSPALATAGTGDVLTGTVAALLARGMQPFAATCAAVHAHGRAGRAAVRGRGVESVIATDVIEALPEGLGPASGEEG
jgi:NAD(P)H-hydrate epimerase